jgi:hypothetical protein
MNTRNHGRTKKQNVRKAYYDGPLEITAAASPRRALMALHGYLASRAGPDPLPCSAETLDRLLGADERWTEPAAMMDPSRSAGRSPDAGELRVLADDLVALLDSLAPDLAGTGEDWERARLYGRTAVGLLRYHYWMADDSPARLARLVGLRDLMMAENLLALAERGDVFAHAHNAHLQRHRSSMRLGDLPVEWWSAGALVSTRLGPEYAFLATGLGTIRHHGVDAPPRDTIEGALYDLPGDPFLADPRRLAAAFGGAAPARRTSPYHGYAPLDPAHLPRIDGIVFVKDAPGT